MDKLEKAIFSTLNKGREIFADEFEIMMLKRFRKLNAKEFWTKIEFLQRQGKIGYFNGYLHSNYPMDYHEKIHKEFESDFASFRALLSGKPTPITPIKCSRCGKYLFERLDYCECIDSTHGKRIFCDDCMKVINRMEFVRAAKHKWKRLRSLGLANLLDLEGEG